MDIIKFAKISESLRQYRRADLRDYDNYLGKDTIDHVYVDPLQGDAILNTVLTNNTTFLLGRKGTGKSTIFAKAQSELRKSKDLISIYIDVKSLYESMGQMDLPEIEFEKYNISKATYQSHMLRKNMLGQIITELLTEVNKACDNLTIFERWIGKKKQYTELTESLESIKNKIKICKLETHEIPTLQKITNKVRSIKEEEKKAEETFKGKATVSNTITGPQAKIEVEDTLSDFDRTLENSDIYREYSDTVFRSFPFSTILEEVQTLLEESGMLRIIAFFDDFSELKILDQRLFVDVILSPLNNISNENFKLKIAGYPGRIYYGKIDPSKTDTIVLDFSELYESSQIQQMEKSAINYTHRLLEKRFNVFNTSIAHYFELSTKVIMQDYYSLIFQASFNVPRIIGHLFHYLYLDKIAKKEKITQASIKLASRKYYESTITKYFDNMNRFALEPYQNKLDRYNQKQLLENLINEAKLTRKNINEGKLGGEYFKGLGTNFPVSHFIVNPNIEDLLLALESNFFLSRYKNTQDKNGKDVIVYSLFLGLCEKENINWGYPQGRHYRNYFVQRCFDYTSAIHEYLASKQTIKCNKCGHCYPMEFKPSLELYKWRCPECVEGVCSILELSEYFGEQIKLLDKEIMLEPIELEIINLLFTENKSMKAGEISSLINSTHQLIGKRTRKLQEIGLIEKVRDSSTGTVVNKLSNRCVKIYFS